MSKSESFLVEGSAKLHGSITPQGAKNEALQVICAVFLMAFRFWALIMSF